MKSSTIGRGVAVTELGFGAASLGNLYRATSDEDARGAVAAAYDAGVRYFDTAPHYGLGLSETRLGAALASRPDVVISTKAGRLLEPNPAPTGSDLAAGGFDVPDLLVRRFDFSRDGILRSIESSLERLGVDRIDIAYLHDPDDHADEAVRHGAPALAELREQGVIGAIGVGMNQWQVPLRLVQETDIDVVMLAGRWTLLDRSGAPLLDACAEHGVAVVVAAPYNSGLLAKPRPPQDATYDYDQAAPELIRRARAMADLCEQHGVTLPDAALQFPLRHPAVVSVVAGLRTAAQVEESVRRLGVPVPEDVWRAIG